MTGSDRAAGPGALSARAPSSWRLGHFRQLGDTWSLVGCLVACAPGTRPEARPDAGAGATLGVVVMDVGPRRVPCMGLSPTRCLRVRTLPDTAWLFFHDAIEGFAYEEGFTWRLEVERRRVPNPPADGSSIAYRLIRVVARKREREARMVSGSAAPGNAATPNEVIEGTRQRHPEREEPAIGPGYRIELETHVESRGSEARWDHEARAPGTAGE